MALVSGHRAAALCALIVFITARRVDDTKRTKGPTLEFINPSAELINPSANSLEPDQTPGYFASDLAPNCLQRSPALEQLARLLGVIAHGNTSTQNTTVERFSYSINIIWTFINTNEVFHIFRSVRSFDARGDVDLIMLLDYDPSVLRMPQLLETKSKDIIIWGDNSKQIESNEDNGDIVWRTNEDICGGEVDPTLYHGDPYCKTDLKSPGDTSFPYESMTVTAPKALVHLIQTLKWKSVFVIHENATVREARVLVDTLSAKQVFLVIFNIDTTLDFHATLRHIYHQTVPFDPQLNFVVLCRFHCARKVFRTANQFDALNTKRKTLLKMFSRWLVTVYGHSKGVSRALQACADDLDNVAIVAIPEFNGAGSSHLEGIVVGMLKDLYIKQSRNGTEIPDVKRYMTELLKQKALSPTSRCKGYNIDTLLWIDSGRGFSSVGYVDVAGNIVLKTELFPNTKFGYNKRRFLISTLEYDPFVRKTVLQNGTVIYEGSTMDLLQELARDLNFTYTMTEPEDKTWGSIPNEANKTFSGLVGQLQKEEVDIVAAPLGHDSIRDKVVDFSFPFYYEYTTVITKKPDPQTTKWRTFVDLFKWNVLVAIVISLGIVTMLIFLIEKYNPFYNIPENGEERSRNGGLHYLHNSFWYIYGALLCQGGVHLPDSTAGRTLVSCWWLMCIVVVGIYSGNLIAFLTVTKEKAPFSTISEMVQAKNYKWGTLGGSLWETIFLTSKIPDYKNIGDGLRDFNKTDPGVLHTNASYHVDRVQKGNYAWIGDKTSIEIAMSVECDLIQIKEEFLPLKYAFGFQRHSPHTLMFSGQIMKINEGGLLQIWKRKWWPKTNFCAANKQMVSKPIALIDVQSAFYVCVIGCFVGFVAFLIETIVFRYRATRNSKEAPGSDRQGETTAATNQ